MSKKQSTVSWLSGSISFASNLFYTPFKLIKWGLSRPRKLFVIYLLANAYITGVVSRNPLRANKPPRDPSQMLDAAMQKITGDFLEIVETDCVNGSYAEISVLLPTDESRTYVSQLPSTLEVNTYPHLIDDNTRDLVQLGSNTKIATCMLIYQIIRQNKSVGFSTQLKTIFPEYFLKESPVWPKQWGEATILQLMHMKAGITEVLSREIMKNFSAKDFAAKFNSLPEVIGLAANYEIKNGCNLDLSCFKPGTNIGYSNTGTMILGLVCERFYRLPFAEVIEKNLLELFTKKYPHATMLYELTYGPKTRENMVHGHIGPNGVSLLPKLGPAGGDITNFPFLKVAGPAGGLTGSAKALARFVRAIFKEDLFNTSDITKMGWVSVVDGSPVEYSELSVKCCKFGCYGFGIETLCYKGEIIFTYTGATLGYQTAYYYFPSTDTIIVRSHNSGVPIRNTEFIIEGYRVILKYLNSTVIHKPKEPKNKENQFVGNTSIAISIIEQLLKCFDTTQACTLEKTKGIVSSTRSRLANNNYCLFNCRTQHQIIRKPSLVYGC